MKPLARRHRRRAILGTTTAALLLRIATGGAVRVLDGPVVAVLLPYGGGFESSSLIPRRASSSSSSSSPTPVRHRFESFRPTSPSSSSSGLALAFASASSGRTSERRRRPWLLTPASLASTWSSADRIAGGEDIADTAASSSVASPPAVADLVRDDGTTGTVDPSSLAPTLHAAQLASASRARSRSREAFHRAMLEARIANDDVARRGGTGGREAEAATVSRGGGGLIVGMPTGVVSDDVGVAISATMTGDFDLSSVDDERPHGAEEDLRDVFVPSTDDADVVDPSMSFATAVDADCDCDQRAIIGGRDDAAPSSGRFQERKMGMNTVVPSPSEADRIRKDRDSYVREIWNCVHGKAIERTKLRMSLRKNGVYDNTSRIGRDVFDDLNSVAKDDDDDEYVGDDDDNDDATLLPAFDAAVRTNVLESSYSGSDGIVKRDFRRRGFVKRVRRQRRNFLLVALVVVLSRRLFLVYFGNALRLI